MKVFKTLSALFAAAPFYGMQNKSVEASGDYLARWEQFKIAEPPMGDTEGYVTADFDLQPVGNLLERADNPQEFAAFLIESNGIDNLDWNADDYIDYVGYGALR